MSDKEEPQSEIDGEIIIPPHKRREIIDDLRLF